MYGITLCGLLWLAYFTWRSVFKFHSYYIACTTDHSMLWLNSIPLYEYTTVINWQTGRCFHSVIMNNAGMNIREQVCCWLVCRVWGGICLGVKFLGALITLCLTFLGNAKCTILLLYQLWMKTSGFPRSFQHLLLSIFYHTYPSGREEGASLWLWFEFP